MKEFFKHKWVKWILIRLGVIIWLWLIIVISPRILGYFRYYTDYYTDVGLSCNDWFEGKAPYFIVKKYCKNQCWLDAKCRPALPGSGTRCSCYDSAAEKAENEVRAKCFQECETRFQGDENRDEYFKCKSICRPGRDNVN